MDKDLILDKIGAILGEILEIDVKDLEINENTCLIGGVGQEDIRLSSIDYVEFLVAIEDSFNVAFDFDQKVNTIGELIDFINDYHIKSLR